VTTTDAGSGTTVINAGVPQPASAPAVPAAAPAPAPAPAPAAAQAAAPVGGTQLAPLAPLAPVGAPQPVDGSVPAPVVATTGLNAAPPASGTPVDPNVPAAAGAPPAPGGIICVPVRVPEPDPKDPTKTIEVEKIACYPAPPPEATPPVNGTAPTAGASTPSAVGADTPSSAGGVPLAPLQPTPISVPEGSVPLAPLQPGGQPDIMRMPGQTSARLSAESGLHDAHSGVESISQWTSLSALVTILVAYCLH